MADIRGHGKTLAVSIQVTPNEVTGAKLEAESQASLCFNFVSAMSSMTVTECTRQLSQVSIWLHQRKCVESRRYHESITAHRYLQRFSWCKDLLAPGPGCCHLQNVRLIPKLQKSETAAADLDTFWIL